MYDYIDNITKTLRLTPYQSYVLKNNTHKYNVARIVKRGGVVYVPYLSRGFINYLIKLFCGTSADLIGQSQILVRNKRNIKFCNDGYHCVQVGQYTYYADAKGRNISRDEFLRETAR